MRNSRKEGLLVVETKPYKVSKDGNYVDVKTVICKDITYDTEFVAMDFEQMFTTSMFNAPTMQDQNQRNKTIANDSSKDVEDFHKKDCPSTKEVDEVGKGLKMFASMSRAVPLSEYVQKFEDLINAGLVYAGDINQQMTIPIWQGIHRDDKLKIVFNYMAFFVNPLQNAVEETKQQEKQTGAMTK